MTSALARQKNHEICLFLAVAKPPGGISGVWIVVFTPARGRFPFTASHCWSFLRWSLGYCVHSWPLRQTDLTRLRLVTDNRSRCLVLLWLSKWLIRKHTVENVQNCAQVIKIMPKTPDIKGMFYFSNRFHKKITINLKGTNLNVDWDQKIIKFKQLCRRLTPICHPVFNLALMSLQCAVVCSIYYSIHCTNDSLLISAQEPLMADTRPGDKQSFMLWELRAAVTVIQINMFATRNVPNLQSKSPHFWSWPNSVQKSDVAACMKATLKSIW